MKLLSTLLWALLPLNVLAAKKSSASTDQFTAFHKKQLSSAPVELEDNTFTQLTRLPRNHTSLVLFTALDPRVKCNVCKLFAPEWDILAKSWVNGDKDGANKIVFGTLDFMNAKNTFQAMNIMTAPLIFLYHPTVGPHARANAEPMQYEFTAGPVDAETVHKWVLRQLPNVPVQPKITRPFNVTRAIVITALVVIGTAFTTIAYPYVIPVLSHRTVWAVGSVLTILLFTSGHMFNHIRGTPYLAQGPNGGVTIYASGFQNQLGLESQIVAGTYAILAFSTVALASKVPRMQNASNQQTAVIIWCAVSLCAYSWLISIFRIKNGSYPFWLPPF